MAAGAHHVALNGPDLIDHILALAPDGVHHIVEVAFGANVGADVELLTVGGSIATYATDVDHPAMPFWPLLFKNIRIDLLGSDDFAPEQKADAARAINDALDAGWPGMPIAERFPLEDIAAAHERLEATRPRGRFIVCP